MINFSLLIFMESYFFQTIDDIKKDENNKIVSNSRVVFKYFLIIILVLL